MTTKEEQIKEFAETVARFFLVFDGMFLYEDEAEELLAEVKTSLKEKVSYNESTLPVIIAMGGSYDSDVDRAKIEEIEALRNLLKARKKLQKATEDANKRRNTNAELLASMFGL